MFLRSPGREQRTPSEVHRICWRDCAVQHSAHSHTHAFPNAHTHHTRVLRPGWCRLEQLLARRFSFADHQCVINETYSNTWPYRGVPVTWMLTDPGEGRLSCEADRPHLRRLTELATRTHGAQGGAGSRGLSGMSSGRRAPRSWGHGTTLVMTIDGTTPALKVYDLRAESAPRPGPGPFPSSLGEARFRALAVQQEEEDEAEVEDQAVNEGKGLVVVRDLAANVANALQISSADPDPGPRDHSCLDTTAATIKGKGNGGNEHEEATVRSRCGGGGDASQSRDGSSSSGSGGAAFRRALEGD